MLLVFNLGYLLWRGLTRNRNIAAQSSVPRYLGIGIFILALAGISYLLWAYSFKLGIYFIILGSTLKTGMSAARKWAVGLGGLIYIGFAYIPLPTRLNL